MKDLIEGKLSEGVSKFEWSGRANPEELPDEIDRMVSAIVKDFSSSLGQFLKKNGLTRGGADRAIKQAFEKHMFSDKIVDRLIDDLSDDGDVQEMFVE